MDANKLKKLQEIGYKVQWSCVICKHGEFGSTNWGTCKRHAYNHEKHTVSKRQLSIHKSGLCPRFKLDESIELGGFVDLVSA